jgi:hypothetical protein
MSVNWLCVCVCVCVWQSWNKWCECCLSANNVRRRVNRSFASSMEWNLINLGTTRQWRFDFGNRTKRSFTVSSKWRWSFHVKRDHSRRRFSRDFVCISTFGWTNSQIFHDRKWRSFGSSKHKTYRKWRNASTRKSFSLWKSFHWIWHQISKTHSIYGGMYLFLRNLWVMLRCDLLFS